MEGSRDQIGCYRDLKQASRGEEQLKALKVVWVVCSTWYAVCGMRYAVCRRVSARTVREGGVEERRMDCCRWSAVGSGQ